MNYKAELRGFALDRAIKIAEVSNDPKFADNVFENADKIVDYLYILDKDIKSHIETFIPLIIQSGDVNRIKALILDLGQIQAEMEAGVIENKQEVV